MEIYIFLLTQRTGKAPLIQVCQVNNRSFKYIYILFQNFYVMNLQQLFSVSNLLGNQYGI